jgi:hypothetical protein
LNSLEPGISDTKNTKKCIVKYINRYFISGIIVIGLIFSVAAIKAYEAIPQMGKILTDNSTTLKQKISSAKSVYISSFSSLDKSLIDLFGSVKKIQGQNFIASGSFGYVRTSDGIVHRIMIESNIEIGHKINSVVNAVKYAEARNAKTMFALVPPNYFDGGGIKLPQGVVDYESKYSNEVMSKLKQNGVYSIDMSKIMPKLGFNMSRIFFKTDHHWKIPAAFIGKNIVVNSLNSKYDLGIDPEGFYADIRNYTLKTYKDSYKGSYITAVGQSFVGTVDDFTSVLPNFDTEFRFRGYAPGGSLKMDKTLKKPCDLTGSFEGVLFDRKFIYKDSKSSYAAYLRGVAANGIIENKKASNDLKVLVIGTSHSRPLAAFLSVCVKTVAFLELQGGNYLGSAYDYIDNFKPDIVLFIYSPQSFAKKDLFYFDR